MLITKPQGYDEAEAVDGSSLTLPAGVYECRILKVEATTTKSTGRPMLNVYFDIVSGEYKDYYKSLYTRSKINFGDDAKWRGVYYQLTDGGSTRFFKGMITAIERSNNFKWNWDTEMLKGKKIGMVMGREQFQSSDGTLKWSTKPVRTCSLDKIATERAPEDKYYKPTEQLYNAFSPAENAFTENGFTDGDDEDDLPF